MAPHSEDRRDATAASAAGPPTTPRPRSDRPPLPAPRHGRRDRLRARSRPRHWASPRPSAPQSHGTSCLVRRRRGFTGISRLPNRDHSDGSAPVPNPRSAAAKPAGSLRRRSASAASLHRGGLIGQHGRVCPSPGEPLDRLVLGSVGELGVRRTTLGSRGRRLQARARTDQHEPPNPVGQPKATCRAIRPPIEYPTSVNGSGARRSMSSITASNVTGRCADASPWPRMSGATASCVSRKGVDHAIPAVTGIGEPVEQNDAGSHAR